MDNVPQSNIFYKNNSIVLKSKRGVLSGKVLWRDEAKGKGRQ